MLDLEREALDWRVRMYNEYSDRIILLLLLITHIPISLLNFGGVACRILFTSSANTPTSWEGNLLFLVEGKYIFRNVFS